MLSYLLVTEYILLLFLNQSKIETVPPAKIRTSSKAEEIPPAIAKVLLFLGCLEISWHSLSSNEEMLTVQLLSTLISTFWTGIVISFEIHCSMYEIISELEALATP